MGGGDWNWGSRWGAADGIPGTWLQKAHGSSALMDTDSTNGTQEVQSQ